MTDRLEEVPDGSNIAKAFRYALSHWEALNVFLRDGRAVLDTNTVERQMRPGGSRTEKRVVRGREEDVDGRLGGRPGRMCA